MYSGIFLESGIIVGDSFVYGMYLLFSGILSKVGYVRFCLNLAELSAKVKYC